MFVVAACGLVYELAAGALASLSAGDSILQFSTVIGTYLFYHGHWVVVVALCGATTDRSFLRVELLVGLVAG